MTIAPSALEQRQEEPRFRSGIELINVTATVTDNEGRFVGDLRKEDFSVYEDGKPQSISQFARDRVPVSLGILLDASGSMNAGQLKAAQAAISHLVFDLLDKQDELFFVEFGYSTRLTQGWTTDRKLIRHALEDVSGPTGDTALRDAIALALPTAQEGRHVKKALLVISDGNDTRSVVSASELRQAVMETDVLVYAVGVDSGSRTQRRPDSRPDVDALRRITDETGVAPRSCAASRVSIPPWTGSRLNFVSSIRSDIRALSGRMGSGTRSASTFVTAD
jgi:Ca-activated chloride channel homolog